MLLKQQYTDQELNALLAEATFHLGRVLYLGEFDFDRAVSELEEAVELDPENVLAYYFLGQAIRTQVERNTLKRAEDVLRTYLLRGAPLGHEDEVREFLGSRMGKGEVR
jgi:tetratricopeptide (TPR) repeat protein